MQARTERRAERKARTANNPVRKKSMARGLADGRARRAMNNYDWDYMIGYMRGMGQAKGVK